MRLFPFLVGLCLCTPPSVQSADTAVRARYHVLTAQPHAAPPFGAVDLISGPAARVGNMNQYWWQLELRPQPGATPLMVLRALTSLNPQTDASTNTQFLRYQLRLPDLGETLEYRDRHTGLALLPAWGDFIRHFVPQPAKCAQRQDGATETLELLGHVLTLSSISRNEPWAEWNEVKVLDLDPELLVGTGRNFKDSEGRRLPQKPERQNYTYVPFTEADYRVMFEAGINLFIVSPAQEPWVRTEPVFYLRGAEGKPPLRYPADLYRANYLGPVMFMDEPSIIMVGDKLIHNTLRYFSDAAALIEKRTRATYLGAGSYGAYALEKALQARGVNFGDMRLMQWDYPSWETLYETTFFQMKGGGAGLVHEGRYQLAEFDQAVARFTGMERKHTARELLQYHYAFLRGGARPFGKFWGTAIYGQCDPAIAPEAVTLAYDMGARYVWFWTSDHDHHLPWPEQLELARTLKRHARAHPRPSIYAPPSQVDTAIVVPNGYFLSLENLWWVRVMDKEGKNEASLKYRRLMQQAFAAVHQCFDRGESFDITVDDGRTIKGYGRLVRLGE
jgi:hypothetical protein